MNFVLLVLLALKILEIFGEDEKETQDRAASLVVLPPLVLGYEELYVDNDDNQPAKKDMDYPNENGGKKDTDETKPNDELEQREKINEEVTTEQQKETKQETTKKEENKVKEKKEMKVEKLKLSGKNANKKSEKKIKKKKDKKGAKKDTKKDNKKKSSKKKKKDKKKGKGKKNGKRKGEVESSQSRSESKGESSDESSDESVSISELSKLYDTLEINNLQELLNNQPSVNGVERIYPSIPTRPRRIPIKSYKNFDQDLESDNQGFTSNKAMILKNRIMKNTPLINDKTNVMGLNLKKTTSSVNELISLLSRRMNISSDLVGLKKTGMRSDDKGVITLKGQGEIGEGKEVLEFTGNFRVPKKVLDCPCFKEILQKETPAF